MPKQELVFFILIEYYKVNPAPGSPLVINIPAKYRGNCSSPWVEEDLRKRGFEILAMQLPHDTITIRKALESDEKGQKKRCRDFVISGVIY